MSSGIFNFANPLSGENDVNMKKTLLLTFFIALAGGLAAQSIWLQKSSETKMGSAADFEVVSYNPVVNTGTAPITLKVTRRIIADNPTFDNAICWQLCYLPNTDTTLDPLTIEPGDTTFNFSGHLYPNNTTGTTTIEYIFYDVANPANQWTYQVTFNVFGVGIDEEPLTVSQPYPNPANDVVHIDIRSAQPSTLEIFDMTGKKVAHRAVSAREGEIAVNVRNLQPGLYFYTVRTRDGQAIQTKRLVIQH